MTLQRLIDNIGRMTESDEVYMLCFTIVNELAGDCETIEELVKRTLSALEDGEALAAYGIDDEDAVNEAYGIMQSVLKSDFRAGMTA